MKIDKLSLLAGCPIEIPFSNGGTIMPKKLITIAGMGEVVYNQKLSLITLDKEKMTEIITSSATDLLKKESIKQELQEKDALDILFEVLLQVPNFMQDYLEALSFFLDTDVLYFNGKNKEITFEKIHLIGKENYDDFISILKAQNCIKEEIDIGKPQNEKAREILEKIKEYRKKLKAQQENEEDKLSLADLVSCLASSGQNGIDIFSIWQMTMYSFNDQFKRMQAIEDYNITIQSLLAGADSKKVDVKYWIRDLDIKEKNGGIESDNVVQVM